MFKSSGAPRSGIRGHSSSAIIDVVQRRSADRLAKVAFIVVWATVTPTVVVVASTITSFLLATVIGLAAGLGTAVLVGLVVLIWPGLRLVWHWTGELILLGLLLAAYLGLTRLMPWWVAIPLMTGTAGVLLVAGPSRRWATVWVWCAISRHRLRVCFATFVRVNRRGTLPLILWARPTPAGERIWVCLRAGLSLEDMTTEGGLARMAVGCWAHEVRLSRAWRRFAPLLRVDITRRNPLSGMVVSPLPVLVPDVTVTDLPVPVQFNPAALDLPGVPTEPAPATPSQRPRSKPSPTPRSKPAPAPATAARTGEDLSEWV